MANNGQKGAKRRRRKKEKRLDECLKFEATADLKNKKMRKKAFWFNKKGFKKVPERRMPKHA